MSCRADGRAQGAGNGVNEVVESVCAALIAPGTTSDNHHTALSKLRVAARVKTKLNTGVGTTLRTKIQWFALRCYFPAVALCSSMFRTFVLTHWQNPCIDSAFTCLGHNPDSYVRAKIESALKLPNN